MTVGRLRRRYSVRERATTRDARGELADVFTEKFKVWGEPPREGSTSNYADAGAQRSEDTMRFRVRWRTGIEIGDQMVDTSTSAETYVQAVFDPDGRKQYLQLVVSQRPSPGS